MRFILRYRYGYFQKKSERVNIVNCATTDDLVAFIEKKTNKKLGEFILRCRSDSHCYRVLRGWTLSDYEITEGDELELEMLEPDETESKKMYSNKYLMNVLGTQKQELRIVEQENEQEDEEARKFNSRQYLDRELEKMLKAVQKGKLQALLKILEQLPENVDEETTIELQRLKPRLLSELGDGGWGAIHYSVFCNKLDILQQLLSRAVDLNKCTSDGWLPLQIASNRKHKQALQILLKNELIRVDEVTSKGTALHIAAKCGYVEGIELLIEAGANWRITDQKGKNSIEVCLNDECVNAISKREEQRAKQEDCNNSFESLAILKGKVYKSKTVFMHLSERYMVLDPYQGSIVFYAKEEDYPKRPKETIPLEELKLNSIELIVGDKRSWQMKKDYNYFALHCPKEMILACKHIEIAVRWVSGLQSAAKYQRYITLNHITEIVPEEDQIVNFVDDKLNKITSNKQVIATVAPPTCHRRKTKVSDIFRRSNISSQLSSESPQMPNKLNTLSISSRPSEKNFGDDETSLGSKKNSNEDEHELCLKVRETNKSSTPMSLNPESKELTSELNKITCQKVNFASFEIVKVLGSGNFGKVFLAKHISSGKQFALKALKKKTLIMKKQIKYAVSQAKILKQANNPFIVNLHYAFQTPNYFYLALDYCPGRDLSFHLASEGTFGEDESRIYIAQLLLAMEHLHSKNILYRDLKPENILLDEQGHIKLADFGLSKDNVQDNTKSFCGTPAYLAPEVLNQKGGCKESDIYGVGLVLYEFLVGETAYYSDNIDTLYNNINTAELKFPKYISDETKSLIKGLMDRDPKKRLGSKGYDEIKNHPFFKSIDWKLAEKRGLKPPVRDFSGDDDDSDDEIAIFTNQKRFVDEDYDQNSQTKPNKLNHFSFVRTYDES